MAYKLAKFQAPYLILPKPRPNKLRVCPARFKLDVFHLTKTQWVTYVIHHCQSDDFRWSLEVFKGRTCCHLPKIGIGRETVKFVWQHPSPALRLNEGHKLADFYSATTAIRSRFCGPLLLCVLQYATQSVPPKLRQHCLTTTQTLTTVFNTAI